MTSFLTDMLARHAAEIEAAVAELKANVNAQIDGIGQIARSASKPARKADAPRKGAKRSPEQLEALTSDLHAYVLKNPGQRIEQIAEGMSTTTKDLRLPVLKLRADKLLSSKGAKRAARYSAK